MMKVYILYSLSLDKYYTGQTQDLEDRLKRHNSGREKFTRSGSPWSLVWHIECQDRSEAMTLERKIKKRGAKRFLEDLE